MKRFKLISCIGLVALIGLVAMPPGAMAYDGIYIDNQKTTFDLTGTVADLDLAVSAYVDIAVLPSTIASGLHPGLTGLKHSTPAHSCTPAASWIGESGDASAYSKPRSLI